MQLLHEMRLDLIFRSQERQSGIALVEQSTYQRHDVCAIVDISAFVFLRND